MNLGHSAKLFLLVSLCVWHLTNDAGNATALIQLATNKSNYRKREVVLVQIKNDMAFPIYTLSGQTYCTIITVERFVNEAWSVEGRCRVLGPPGWVEIAAGGTSLVEIKPILPSDQVFIPGRYRAKLTFNVGSKTGSTQTCFSSDFQINNNAQQ
jgi:hypothetical protein